MKLLPEQEKDNFGKLNPAQKALSTAGRAGVRGNPLARRDTRTNAWQFIAISVLGTRLRSKKNAYRTSLATDALCVFDHAMLVARFPDVYGEYMCRGAELLACVISPDSGRDPLPFVSRKAP